MRPDQIVQLGPMVFALDRLVAIGLFLSFLVMMDRIVVRWSLPFRHAGIAALIAGLIGARGAYVLDYRESFALEPVAAAYVWLGGWHWPGGVSIAAIVIAATVRKPRAIAASLAVLVLLSGAWWAYQTVGNRPTPPLLLSQKLILETPAGRTLTLKELRGRPVVINLWASWCPPCRREMPMLVAAASAERRAVILLVNQGEDMGTVSAFLRDQRLESGAIALDRQGLLPAMTGAQALPTTFFVDHTGRLRHMHMGEITKVQLDIAIRRLKQPEN